MENKVSAELEQTVYDGIIAAINQISDQLPFLINLTPEQKKVMPKYGDRSVAFVKKSHELASQNPDILPQSFELAEMGKDIALYDKLYAILQPLLTLVEKMECTLQELGAEAYSSALYIYSLAKLHKQIGDFSSETFDDLARRFVSKSSKSKDEA